MATAASASRRSFTYFSAWFCPFAHRATIALEHHTQKYIGWEWQEALGWEHRPPTGEESFDASARDDWYYHWKSPELLEANPLGMVPTLRDVETGRVVRESLVCVEFIDEVARAAGSDAFPLVPLDPFDRASCRVAADMVNKLVMSNYYAVLVRQDTTERQDAFRGILRGLESFAADMRGSYFMGDAGPSLVDCVLFPYAWRLFALEHYRGPDFAVPETPAFRNYHDWLRRMSTDEKVKTTLPDPDRYLQHVEKYASGRARSKVGNAVRRGQAAHSYDDVIDGDATDPEK